MFTVFNIVVIGVVGLIAYWWANQGLFSAILHLLCVIAAGAVALAVWEPLTVGLLLRGNGFDDYAWGISLIGVFVITLLILRVTIDKTIGANVDLPLWANLVFGFPIGAAAGILTAGIFLIGAGFIQSSNNVMGFFGMTRQKGTSFGYENRLWLPVHELTNGFYSLLSVNSLSTDQPLRRCYPKLDDYAAGLVHDSFMEGRAKISLSPADVHIEEAMYSPEERRYAVKMTFQGSARDFGEQLTLSSSQIRLIGDAKEAAEAKVIHPDRWTQFREGAKSSYVFDDRSHYISSEPGQATAEVDIEFDVAGLNGAMPRFIQIRGTRFKLPLATQVGRGGLSATAGTGAGINTVDAGARSIDSAIEQSIDIKPVQASINQKPPGIELTDRYISAGDGDFIRNGERPAKLLQILGIFQPAGTRIVQVDISRESVANIFSPALLEKAGPDPKLMLVDSAGRAYYPIGFIHEKPDNKTRIVVDSTNFVATMNQIPSLPTSGGQKLKLLFDVTDNSTIVGLKLGVATVGNCKIVVRDPKGGTKEGAPSSFGVSVPPSGTGK